MGWVAANLLLNNEQKDEECDATEVDSSTEAGKIKIIRGDCFSFAPQVVWQENYY